MVKQNHNSIDQSMAGASTSAWDDALNSRRDQGVDLSMRKIHQIVSMWNLPAIMTLDQAAALVRLAPGTIRNHVSEGRYPTSAITGKPLRFLTAPFIQEFARRGHRS